MKNIIEKQYRDEDRAVFGKGSYEVRQEFQHLMADDKTWSKMSHEQLMAKVEKYVKSGMDAKKVVVNKEVEIDNISSQDSLARTITLPITASDSGITTVPMPILQAMFEKANQLLVLSSRSQEQLMDNLLSLATVTPFTSLHLERADV